jgi:predicted ATP-dependent endonuclease of OLD family
MYKIVNVLVQNVKRIKMVDITPKSNVVILEGKNAQGKTSFLDAIEFALSGKSSLPPKPIRDGAETALTRVDIGDYIVERNWTSSGNTYLGIIVKETGLAVKAPQAFLDEIIGRLSFDPFKFVSMTAAERIQEIKSIAGIDFTALENKYNIAYSQRTDLNRDLTKLKGEMASYNILPEIVPTRNIKEIQQLIINAEANNSTKNAFKQQMVNKETSIASMEANIADIDKQIKELNDRRLKGQNLIAQAQTELMGIKQNFEMVKEIDTAELNKELVTASEQAGLKYKHERKTELKTSISKTEKDIMLLETTMEDAKSEKAEILRAAKMPIDGLAIGKDDIYFNDQPFVQISDSQKIKVSCSIAAAKISDKTKLQFIQIRNASLLDAESFESIKQFAVAHDVMIWMERVANEASGDDSAFYIEDGTIKERK